MLSITRLTASCAAATILLVACGGGGLSGDYGGARCLPYEKLSFQSGGVVDLTGAIGGQLRGSYKVDGDKVIVDVGGASMVYTRKDDDLTTSLPLLGESVCTKNGAKSSASGGPVKSDSFCDDWAKVDTTNRKFEADTAALDARHAEPTVANMKGLFKPFIDGMNANLAALEKSAPSELKAAINDQKKGMQTLSARIEKAGYDFSKIDESELATLMGAFEASGTKVDAYVGANCK